MNTVDTLKRLYKDYTKNYVKKIAFAMALSVVIAGSTSAIAYLLDPAIKKIFIDQDAKLIIIIPLLIIFAFTAKGASLYFARLIMIGVAQDVTKDIQSDMVKSLIKADTQLIDNKHTGTLGNLGIFSFSATKIITSGEGGMVVTNDNELANKIKLIRNHGFNRENNVVIKGTNYTMPEIEAAIGHIQLKKIEKLIQIRKKNADILNKLINNKNIIKPHEGKENRNNWYLYTIKRNR